MLGISNFVLTLDLGYALFWHFFVVTMPWSVILIALIFCMLNDYGEFMLGTKEEYCLISTVVLKKVPLSLKHIFPILPPLPMHI